MHYNNGRERSARTKQDVVDIFFKCRPIPGFLRKEVVNKHMFFLTESIAYEFGPGRGIITYTFAPDALEDSDANKIALGFVTNKADAVLLRIESSNTQDYMQMEIVSVNGKTNCYVTGSLLISFINGSPRKVNSANLLTRMAL